MKLVAVAPRVCSDSLEPTVQLGLEFSLVVGREIPVWWHVALWTRDSKVLAEGILEPLWSDLEMRAEAQSESMQATLPATCRCQLSPRALDKIQTQRDRHKKRDVELTVVVKAALLIPRVYNATLYLGEGAQGQRGMSFPVMYVLPQGPYQSERTNLWVLSGDNSRTFLKQEIVTLEQKFVIGSGDWVHDFESHFRSTSYLVVELPSPGVPDPSNGLSSDRVAAALQAVRKAEASLQQGEWSDAMLDLRPVWELVRDHQAFGDLLTADGYTSEAIVAFNGAAKSLFDLASKFTHRLDKPAKNVTPEIRAQREDAILCFSTAAALLNCLTRKAARQS